jgi:hypothetical protein
MVVSVSMARGAFLIEDHLRFEGSPLVVGPHGVLL